MLVFLLSSLLFIILTNNKRRTIIFQSAIETKKKIDKMNDIIVGIASEDEDGLKDFLSYMYGDIKIIKLKDIDKIK